MHYLRLLQHRRMAADGGGGGEAQNPAAQGEAAATTQQEGATAGKDDAAQEGKAFSQADVDRIVSQRVAAEQRRLAVEQQKAVADAVTEAERMAKMSADERARVQAEKDATDLAAREAKLTQRELRAEALENLAEKSLPRELAEALVYTDADACKASLDAVEKAFKTAVEAQVNERLRSAPPKTGVGGKAEPTLADSIRNQLFPATQK